MYSNQRPLPGVEQSKKGVIFLLQTVELLHQSDKSTVALVIDTETGKKVVRKELSGRHLIYSKLQTIYHPYLPNILSVRLENGKTIVTEEYIEGASLGRISLSERGLTRAFLELCQVLEFLHGHGILHRDIKPDNILLAPDGHIRLIDFDAAREPKANEAQDTRLLGTRGYAPPEQFGFAQTDARADLYALGATFRQLLGPVARKGRWRHILRRCTALDPKDRYASAGQIRRAVYRGRVFRWAVRPACAVLLALLLLVSGAVLANTSSRLALFSVLGLADTQVWEEEQIDLAALRQAVENGTAPLMYEYSGPDALIAYDRLREQYPDLLILYSGYMDREGAMVFGCVESTFLIRYGAYTFEGLHSVVKVTPNGRIEPVTTADYDGCAPAVIALYETIDAMPRSS